MFTSNVFLLLLALSFVLQCSGLRCFVCDADDVHCSRLSSNITSVECEHVHNPFYCVKMEGVVDALSSCYILQSMGTFFLVLCRDNMPSIGNKQSKMLLPYYLSKVDKRQLGTRRFCSSVNAGNECYLVRRPGDDKDYQSCVFTCSTDGCNSSSSVRAGELLVTMSLFCALLKMRFL